MAKLWLGRIGHIAIRDRFNVKKHKKLKCDYLTGCAFLIRREILRAVGGFDTIFGLYNEDVDLSLKIRKLGWELWVIPEAKVYHQVSASAGGSTSPLKAFHLSRSTAILLKRYIPIYIWLFLIPIGFLGGVLKSIKLISRGFFKSTIAMWLGILTGMFNLSIPKNFKLNISD